MKMPNFKLVSGVGNYDEGEYCIMSAAVACERLKRGEPLGKATDELDCCCPVIRAFLISINDSSIWESDDERTAALSPFIMRLANTRDMSKELKRAYLLVDWGVRTIAADALELMGLVEQSQKLRAIAEIVDVQSANAARDAAAYAVDAAARVYSVRAAARAAAYVAYASAARAAAAATADADAAAAAAADAAAAATDAAATADADAAAYADSDKSKIVGQVVEIIEKLLSV
jgi:hypothetical protein